MKLNNLLNYFRFLNNFRCGSADLDDCTLQRKSERHKNTMFESVLLAGLNPRNSSPGERFLQQSRHNVVYFCNDGDCLV